MAISFFSNPRPNRGSEDESSGCSRCFQILTVAVLAGFVCQEVCAAVMEVERIVARDAPTRTSCVYRAIVLVR